MKMPAGIILSALEMHALDHVKMVAAVLPYIDTAISKTVNVPADYPFAEFSRCIWKPGKPA